MRVTIDGAIAARLRPKHEVSLTLAPGTYQVQARLQWSRSHSLTLSVSEQGSVTVEVGAPWRLSLFSSTPGSLNIRAASGLMSPTGYRRQHSNLTPRVFDPAAHRPGRSLGQVPAVRWMEAFLKRRHPAWGIALIVAGFSTIPFNSGVHLHPGWIGGLEHNLIGLATPTLFLAGMFVLGEWAAQRDAARERRD